MSTTPVSLSSTPGSIRAVIPPIRRWHRCSYELTTRNPEGPGVVRRRVEVCTPFREAGPFGAGRLEGETLRPRNTGRLRLPFGQRLNQRELADFFEAMGTGIKRGGNAGLALEGAGRVARTPLMRGHVAALRHLTGSGSTLAEAMRSLPGFSDTHAAITEAADQAGNLGEVYLALAQRLNASVALGRKLIGNLIYPSVLLLTSIGVALFLGLGVVPKYGHLYRDMGANLPWPTALFVHLGDLVRDHGLILAIGLVAYAAGVCILFSRIRHTRTWHRLKMRLPLVGPVVTQLALTRSLHIYSLLTAIDLPAQRIFELVGRASGNLVVKEYFDAVYRRIFSGRPETEALALEWPRLGAEGVVLAGKVSVGAATGDTAALMRGLAADYQSRAETTLGTLPQVINIPVMLLMALILVPAVLALALPLPMLIARQLQIMAQ